MIAVILAMGGIWGLGAVLGVARPVRWAAIAALWGAVMLAHLTLPEGHALRLMVGGSARGWGFAAVLVAVVAVYRQVLMMARSRARPAKVQTAKVQTAPDREAPGAPGFAAAELPRYARHIMLREIGGPGQNALKQAKVLVVGAGGLGAPALLYLAAAGVGRIRVIDDDLVEGSNLQRQVIHTEASIGTPKVQSAAEAMRALNPYVSIEPDQRRLTAEIAAELFPDYDLILDGTDGFDTRLMINAAAVQARVPLISAAISQWEGQISLYDPARGTPCYACVFPQAPAPGQAPSCAEAGVVGPLPGVMGAMMATEAVKHLTGAGETLANRLLIYDALYAETRQMRLSPRADCPICHPTGDHDDQPPVD